MIKKEHSYLYDQSGEDCLCPVSDILEIVNIAKTLWKLSVLLFYGTCTSNDFYMFPV